MGISRKGNEVISMNDEGWILMNIFYGVLGIGMLIVGALLVVLAVMI